MISRNERAKKVFLGVFLVITPPVVLMAAAAFSVRGQRNFREGIAGSYAIWDVVFPIALIASILCVPLGAYVIYKAFSSD